MSVFTYESDPPRVSSPWLRAADRHTGSAPTQPPRSALEHYGVEKLEAEPQKGPIEYKEHMLLRQRRTYLRMRTPTHTFTPVKSCSSSEAWSARARDDRLEHLTTQLLWRLQQSSPYHSGSPAPDLAKPKPPEASAQLNGPVGLASLQRGLEESRGALYEIGVADDGTLKGLTDGEMKESLATLRIVAARLGCKVQVLRRVKVGDCEWNEVVKTPSPNEVHCKEPLWVVEALVTTSLRPGDATTQASDSLATHMPPSVQPDLQQGPHTANQLRISLTGPTTCGKSSLLGTLTSGVLDNGKGQSRLNLLRHRHEVESGVTSSLAQELIGYDPSGSTINYASAGVESWIDIHSLTRSGRLVFMVDSAGHLRFRRSIMRGLVGMAPHWTLLCIDPASGDLAATHLDWCLQLKIPLVVVVTKIDLANKTSLPSAIGRVFSAIKKTGRVPRILQQANGQSNTTDLRQVASTGQNAVADVTTALSAAGDLLSLVPVVLTSAVSGIGIGLLHALLQALPLPAAPTPLDYVGAALNPEQPACLFHIESTFNLPALCSLVTSNQDQQTEMGTVMAGYLRFGTLSVGDDVVVGPFPGGGDDACFSQARGHRSPSGAVDFGPATPDSSTELNRAVAARNAAPASNVKGEWRKATIVSIRNLRLPVQTLVAGQVGSIGLVLASPEQPAGADDVFESPIPAAEPLLRKGMVVAVPSQHMVTTGLSLQAASGLTAVFEGIEATTLAAGSLVSVYVASVHATARVVRVSGSSPAYHDANSQDGQAAVSEEAQDEVFHLQEGEETGKVPACAGTELRLELLNNREWIELGSRIVIMQGSGKGTSGLEGFVGMVIEIME